MALTQIFESRKIMKKSKPTSIGEKMKEIRGEMSQRQASELVGIKPQNWNVYEKDQSVPGAEVVIKLCQTFNVSADWLLGLSDDRGGSAAPAQQKIIAAQPDILREIRELKKRVNALESSTSMATCG